MVWNVLSGLIICFSMYSAVPVPHLNWDSTNMKYVFCFFPVVGLVIGGLECLWFFAAHRLSLDTFFYAAVASVIPVLISGGIHIDGLIDTCDAVFSYGDREKKLSILKDPHVGAFGIIYCIVYFIIMLGVYSQLFTGFQTPVLFIMIFALSRGITGLVTINWKSAKNSGLKYLFTEGTSKKPVNIVLILWVVVFFVIIGLSDVWILIFGVICPAVFYLWFYFHSRKQFGGITGDLAGFSLSITELILITSCAVSVIIK